MFAHEDNAVSEDENFKENESDTADNVGSVAQMNEAAEEVTVADADDVHIPNSRPWRINAGKGIEIPQMDFQCKVHQSKR